mmetsp:Transcript_99594/g.287504  ORF Transcript_99594/g.287504 Transcript_99594/m.287504 type:complete len:250 (+) Transcript_99594:115-864(+)
MSALPPWWCVLPGPVLPGSPIWPRPPLLLWPLGAPAAGTIVATPEDRPRPARRRRGSCGAGSRSRACAVTSSRSHGSRSEVSWDVGGRGGAELGEWRKRLEDAVRISSSPTSASSPTFATSTTDCVVALAEADVASGGSSEPTQFPGLDGCSWEDAFKLELLAFEQEQHDTLARDQDHVLRLLYTQLEKHREHLADDLIQARHSAEALVDLQRDSAHLCGDVARLLEAARVLGMPHVVVTSQPPNGQGA